MLDKIKVSGGEKYSLDNIPSLRLSSSGKKVLNLDGDNSDEFWLFDGGDIFNTGGKQVASAEGDKAISLEAKAILHLFNKVLEQRSGFSDKDKELIEGFFKNNGKQQGSSAPTQVLENGKLEIIKTALLQRNKYNADGSKNTDANRAQGTSYEKLKTILQTLNKNNINFTTESLKLFNDDGKTLGTRKEVDNLIEKKPCL